MWFEINTFAVENNQFIFIAAKDINSIEQL